MIAKDRGRLKIVCVHQGGEMYGSDRSFLQVVTSLRKGWPDAHIRVLLAADGPLRLHLEAWADDVIIQDMLILRLIEFGKTILKGSFGLGYYLLRAKFATARADLVYINTTVIADFMIAARLRPERAVIHVREIPKRKALYVVKTLLRISGASLIFNSKATSSAFEMTSRVRTKVILNSVDDNNCPILISPPSSFSISRPLRIAMLGRINDWKGQDLLVEAASLFSFESRKLISIRIVGGTFRDSAEPILALHKKIEDAGLANIIRVEGFSTDPQEVYRWSDLCVVPSRLPEPFGRVAVEAMAFGRPVIAAEHGGLTEIVDHKINGWLFRPNDAKNLHECIDDALREPFILHVLGTNARDTFEKLFTFDAMSRTLQSTLAEWIPALDQPQA